MMTNAKRLSPLLLEKLQPPSSSPTNSVPTTFSRIGSYIGAPVVLTDGTLFGVLGAADPEPQMVKSQQPAMLAVLARRIANEIELDYEQTQRKLTQAKLAKALVALSEANKQLEQMNKLKSDFISVVSHEFRTALTTIRGFSEMMRDENFSLQEMKEFAADINNDTMRLNRMITDMLDLDRIESGKMALQQEQVDLNTLITDVVDRMRPTVPDHTFHLQLDNALLPTVGDRDKLIQVLTNLLSNAVKYSNEGGEILLRSRLEDNFIRVQVQDFGMGIPADELEHVFEHYRRVEAANTRYIQGTGLGLPIVRQILQLHGGKVWAESEYGQGSAFHFTLPLTTKSTTMESNNG
jgi:signal transduction histidine kinase